MRFYDNLDLICQIGERDTFAVPIVIKHHVPLETEEYVFTVRRVLEGHRRMGKPPVFGDIVYQKIITYNDIEQITDDAGDVVGCRFFVVATADESANIPSGVNSYDLAVREVVSGMEMELISPHKFIVGEVLRYE